MRRLSNILYDLLETERALKAARLSADLYQTSPEELPGKIVKGLEEQLCRLEEEFQQKIQQPFQRPPSH